MEFNANAANSGQLLAVEALPPYSPFEPNTAHTEHFSPSDSRISEALQEHEDSDSSSHIQWHNSDIIPAVVLEPSGLELTFSENLAQAMQHLRPTQAIMATFEGMLSTKVVVRSDTENRYCGLVCVLARFRHSASGQVYEGLVSATSQVDVKSNTCAIDFAIADTQHSGQLVAECEIVLPRGTLSPLPGLSLRLPAGSRLGMAGIRQAQLTRFEVAAISGIVQLEKSSLDSMRIAIADGKVDVVDVDIKRTAELVAIQGEIKVDECVAGENIRVNAPAASLEIANVVAQSMAIKGKSGTVILNSVRADSLAVTSVSGPVTLEEITAFALSIDVSTSPVRGSWTISRELDIRASAAIIQGKLTVANADDVHIRIRTSEWPARLVVNEDFVGYFDVRAVNSVVSFGLADNITFYENRSNWRKGVVGISSNVLDVESTNSPVIFSDLYSANTPVSQHQYSACFQPVAMYVKELNDPDKKSPSDFVSTTSSSQTAGIDIAEPSAPLVAHMVPTNDLPPEYSVLDPNGSSSAPPLFVPSDRIEAKVDSKNPKEPVGTATFDFKHPIYIHSNGVTCNGITIEPDTNPNNQDTVYVTAHVISPTNGIEDRCHFIVRLNDYNEYDFHIDVPWSFWNLMMIQCKISIRLPSVALCLHPGIRGEIERGKIEMASLSNVTFGHLNLRTSCGNVSFKDVCVSDFKVVTSDGAMKLRNVVAKDKFDVKTSNYKLELEDIRAQELSATTSNRAIELFSVAAERLRVETSNAPISCRNVEGSDVDLRTSNASIDTVDVVADSLRISTTNAKIGGMWKVRTLLDTYTTNGSIDGTIALADATSHASIRMSTTNGNIRALLPAGSFRGTVDSMASNGAATIQWSNPQVPQPPMQYLVDTYEYKRVSVGEQGQLVHDLVGKTNNGSIDVRFV
ncbi:hypothetical protein GGI12_002979 [Dipsacomyces acuminosporus]|nr:hypothetical protein GGI12_002979 [Dipsacomyces acuminosporus]